MTASDVLVVDRVDKVFGPHTVLDAVSLSVPGGGAVVLRGPNGAGKSTLLSCIAGTLVPDRGTVTIDGHPMKDEPLAARAAMRYLPQEVEVPAGITGRELITLSADIFGADAAQVERAASLTGLGDALDRFASTYSVGMRRRLAFGSLMLGAPALFVLDEPFAGVDADGRARLLHALTAAKERGAGIVLAAHDRDAEDVARLAPTRFDLGEALHDDARDDGRDPPQESPT
ncbi:MAG: ABC transporter ATP-binding protein [Myxococcota bacterium]